MHWRNLGSNSGSLSGLICDGDFSMFTNYFRKITLFLQADNIIIKLGSTNDFLNSVRFSLVCLFYSRKQLPHSFGLFEYKALTRFGGPFRGDLESERI